MGDGTCVALGALSSSEGSFLIHSARLDFNIRTNWTKTRVVTGKRGHTDENINDNVSENTDLSDCSIDASDDDDTYEVGSKRPLFYLKSDILQDDLLLDNSNFNYNDFDESSLPLPLEVFEI